MFATCVHTLGASNSDDLLRLCVAVFLGFFSFFFCLLPRWRLIIFGIIIMLFFLRCGRFYYSAQRGPAMNHVCGLGLTNSHATRHGTAEVALWPAERNPRERHRPD